MKTLLRNRDIITLNDLDTQELRAILEVSQALKRDHALGLTSDMLRHKTLFMMFFEQSTRTRNSLEAGMTQLGGHAHDLTPDKMQITHGESPKDTAAVLSRMGEAIAIRNCFHGIGNGYITEIARHAEVPVISMQDDIYHPLQGLADQMTIEEYYGRDTRGLKVAIMWAYADTHAKPLSVPQTQALLFPRFGIDVVVANPVEFPLSPWIIEAGARNAQTTGGSLTVTNDPTEAVRDADIVIPKNWGGFGYFDDYREDDESTRIMRENLQRNRHWICDEKLFDLARHDAKIMHALPADRGHEVTDALLDGPHSIIYDEAENRLHTAKAVLSLVMGGRP